jgi:chromosome segregation ATPase
MSNLENALAQLREEHKQAQQQVEKLQSAISVIEDLVGRRNGSVRAINAVRPRHTVSAASRRKMALAQRARWARVNKESQPAAVTGKTTTAPVKRTMSVAARRKIAAFQRARWAKLKKAA